jgi:hypothetical protein
MGNIMKTIIILVILTVITFIFSGCGPGQPFEIESQHTPQSEAPIQVAVIR